MLSKSYTSLILSIFTILAVIVSVGLPSQIAPPASSHGAVIAFNTAYTRWASGNQSEAEGLLDGDVVQFPNDQHLAFFRAACTRSRWEIDEAKPLFQSVVQLQPSTPEAKCAIYVLHLDGGVEMNANFQALSALAKQHPTDILILWMLAVECRQLERDYFGTSTADDVRTFGIACYGNLLSKLKNVGSSLVHQTYANLLDDDGNAASAVIHRRLAAELEPTEWSCSSLIDDLDTLGLTAEAAQDRIKYAQYLKK